MNRKQFLTGLAAVTGIAAINRAGEAQADPTYTDRDREIQLITGNKTATINSVFTRKEAIELMSHYYYVHPNGDKSVRFHVRYTMNKQPILSKKGLLRIQGGVITPSDENSVTSDFTEFKIFGIAMPITSPRELKEIQSSDFIDKGYATYIKPGDYRISSNIVPMLPKSTKILDLSGSKFFVDNCTAISSPDRYFRVTGAVIMSIDAVEYKRVEIEYI